MAVKGWDGFLWLGDAGGLEIELPNCHSSKKAGLDSLADGFWLFIAMFDQSSQETQSWLPWWLIVTAVECVIMWLTDGELMVNGLVD